MLPIQWQFSFTYKHFIKYSQGLNIYLDFNNKFMYGLQEELLRRRHKMANTSTSMCNCSKNRGKSGLHTFEIHSDGLTVIYPSHFSQISQNRRPNQMGHTVWFKWQSKKLYMTLLYFSITLSAFKAQSLFNLIITFQYHSFLEVLFESKGHEFG